MKNKTKIFITALLLVMTLTFFVGCTEKNSNILKIGANNQFKYESLTTASSDWTFTTAESSSVSNAFSIVDDALVINTVSAGWAKATQEVNLAPNSYYLIEYTFTSTGFSSYSETGYDGLYVTIVEDESFNTGDNAVHHRGIATTKTTGKIYFKTTQAKKTTLAINVGTEKYPVNVTAVTISDIKLVKVPKSQIVSEDASYFTFVSDTYSEASTKNIPYVVFGALAIALFCYAAYVLFQRNMAIGGEYKSKFMVKLVESKWLGVITVASVALAIRLFIGIIVTAFANSKLHYMLGFNVEGYASQALFLGNYGTVFLSESLGKFCASNSYTYLAPESSPLQLYLLAIVGLISRIFGSHQYLAATFFVKFFASVADIGTVVLIYSMLKKHVGNVGSTIIALLYALLPVTFAVSSLWGFTESVTVFLMALTFFFILKNNYYGVAASYLAAFLFSWTAIIVAPIIIFYTIQQAINNKKLLIPIAIVTVASIIIFYLANLPFTINAVKGGAFFACVTNYWNMVFKGAVYTRNAYNFQGLLSNNFAEVSTESLIVTIIFVLFLLGLVAFAYFKFKNRMNLMLLATAFINMFFVFGNNMTQTSIYMSLALMLVYAIINKEKRIFFSFAAFSTLMFVNVAMGELLTSYTINTLGIIPTNAVTYVFGALYLVFALYYVYIVYDIVAMKKIRRIQPMTLTYLGWWKNVFLRIKKNYYKLRIRVAK